MSLYERVVQLLEQNSGEKSKIIKIIEEEYKLNFSTAKEVVDFVAAGATSEEIERIQKRNIKQQQVRFCSICRQPIEKDWKVCPRCGAELLKNTIEEADKPIKPPKKIWKKVLNFLIAAFVILLIIGAFSDEEKNEHANNNKNIDDLKVRESKEFNDTKEADYVKKDILNTEMPVEIKGIKQVPGPYDLYVGFDVTCKNNSGIDIKEAVLGIMAWDEDGFPLITTTMIEEEYLAHAGLNNLKAGELSDTTWNLDMKKFAKYTQIYCLEYTDFDGNVWENPYMEQIESNGGKKLEDIQGKYFEFEEDSNQEKEEIFYVKDFLRHYKEYLDKTVILKGFYINASYEGNEYILDYNDSNDFNDLIKLEYTNEKKVKAKDYAALSVKGKVKEVDGEPVFQVEDFNIIEAANETRWSNSILITEDNVIECLYGENTGAEYEMIAVVLEDESTWPRVIPVGIGGEITIMDAIPETEGTIVRILVKDFHFDPEYNTLECHKIECEVIEEGIQ